MTGRASGPRARMASSRTAKNSERQHTMSTPETGAFPVRIHWESDGTSRIPFMAYTDEAQHRKELERFFYTRHWNYVGLEAEIPAPGDFKRTVVGERSVLMVRDAE